MADPNISYIIAAIVVVLILIIIGGMAWRWKHQHHLEIYRIQSPANGATLQWHTGTWALVQTPGMGDLITLGPRGEVFDYPSGRIMVPPTQNAGESRVALLPAQAGQKFIAYDPKGYLIISAEPGMALAGNSKPTPILYGIGVLDNKWALAPVEK